ncbi:MAG TPA: hypothetical protein VGC91_04725 [Pyrinomonadaceae bacterium]
MNTKIRALFFALLLAVLLVVPPVHAQTAADAQVNIDSLSTLPESEALVFLNAPRIVNEAIPRLLPEKENQDFRKQLDEIKAFTGIDLHNVEFVVLAMRFNKPANGTLYPLPEAMFAMRGDFNAEALIGMAMMMSQGKLKDEKYGSHTLSILKLDDIAKDASKNPFGVAYSEIALTTLDPQTIAVGNTAYIKAALDAADGRGRIKAERLQSALREPNALITFSGSPITAFAKSFGLRMAEPQDNCNCGTRFGDYYVGLNMDAQNFKLTGAMNADNPETAGIIRNMLSGLFNEAKSRVPDKSAQSIMNEMKLIAEGSEVMLQANIPQEMAAQYVREMMAPKPKPPAMPVVLDETKATTAKAEAKQPAKTKSKSRRARRRK